MKYCSSCKSIITEDIEKCHICHKSPEEIAPDSPVTVAVVKGNVISLLEPALKDSGIPCCFEKKDGSIYNEYNIKISSESDFRVIVPFEMYNKAFNICEGFAFVKEEDRLIPAEDNENEDNRNYNEKFEAATGVKHHTWQMLGIVAFIVLACLVIWGVDFIAEWIKGMFY